MTDGRPPFDTAPDCAELLDYLMWRHSGAPQKREVALANLRSLDTFGLAQLRAEMRCGDARASRVATAEYNPWEAFRDR